MRSNRVVDLRRRKPGASMRPFAFRDPPPTRRSPLRVRRRRTRVLFALLVMSLIAGGVYGISLVSYLPQLSVQRIDVAGANDIRPELVRAFVETELSSDSFTFFSPSNIFLYPRTEIEAAIEEYFPRVENARISRESLLANAITVSIEEREPFARWCSISRASFTEEQIELCYAIDTGGFIFAPVSTTTAAFATRYVFEGSLATTSSPVGQTYLSGTFAGVVTLLERLGQAGFSPERISAEGEQDFSVNLSQSFTIRASFGADVGSLVRNLELVLSSEALRGEEDELEYIDLRFGNRVYYKLKGVEQQSAQ